MNHLTITAQLCQEDRDRLDRIIAALEKTPDFSKCVADVAEYTAQAALLPIPEQPAKAPKDTEAPQPIEDTTPEEKPAEKATEVSEQPSVTHADIQKKVVELSAAGKKAQVREIVTAYAGKVSDIPVDKLAEVWQKLTALEG